MTDALTHYLTLALERADVDVTSDMRSEMRDILSDIEDRLTRIESRLAALDGHPGAVDYKTFTTTRERDLNDALDFAGGDYVTDGKFKGHITHIYNDGFARVDVNGVGYHLSLGALTKIAED